MGNIYDTSNSFEEAFSCFQEANYIQSEIYENLGITTDEYRHHLLEMDDI